MQWWAEQYAQLKSHECYFVTTTLRGGRKDVTLRDLFGAFLMLLGGLGISSTMIVIEVMWRRFYRTGLKNNFENPWICYINRIILKKKKFKHNFF